MTMWKIDNVHKINEKPKSLIKSEPLSDPQDEKL